MSPRIQAIVDRATEEIRAALLAEAKAMLGSLLNDGPRTPKKPGPKPKSGPAGGGKKMKDGRYRRSPAEIEKTMGSILAHVKKHPGSRAEQIGAALGLKTKDITGPITALLSTKALAKKGKLRGTTYTAK